ncbi:hypothetical protein HanRHA438_Chr11g0490791 [Helianthus annuus]|nr:hypothetical protein HanRHA438_Chr11g0490791 [Helianthus annuus]
MTEPVKPAANLAKLNEGKKYSNELQIQLKCNKNVIDDAENTIAWISRNIGVCQSSKPYIV